jgi:hypothetical protein
VKVSTGKKLQKGGEMKKMPESCDKSKLDGRQREVMTRHQELLSRRISDLALRIPGTRLEKLINELYKELETAGISFKPKTYLSDEWGCPQGVPVIGIPFYLVDPRLCEIEGALTGIEAENEAEVMMCLRHEAGHAFNYAYRLYLKTEWKQTFGPFSRTYREEYKTVPFSARFVRHIPGWYVQKHPDEDFAETFAVWLTPGLDWMTKYADTPALAKLLYVDGIIRRYGRKPPMVTDAKLDRPVEELKMTLDTWYDANKQASRSRLELHPIIDEDLLRLFADAKGQPAEQELRHNSRRLAREVNYWTGMDRRMLDSLLNELIERVRSLGLKIDPDQVDARMASAAVFITTLAMNYQFRGQFVDG